MRLLPLTPPMLDPAQKTLYDEIAGGARAQGPQHFRLIDDTGALTGPFGIMLHVPELGSSLQELGAAIRYRTSLTARIREVAILSVAAANECAFERYAHERVGRAAGLSDQELDDLASGSFTSDDPREDAAYRLCGILNVNGLPLPDEAFAGLSDELGSVAMIELCALVGYYRTLSQMLNLFEVGIPE